MAQEFKKGSTRYQKYFLNIKSIYSTRQDVRMFLEILLSIAAVSFFIFLAIRPTLVTVGKLLTEIREKESISAQLSTKIENLNIARSLFEANRIQLELLNLAVPDTPKPEEIIRQIEGIAQRNNVEIVRITTEDIGLVGEEEIDITNQIEGFESMPISFLASGSYGNIVNFLKDAQNLRRPLLIDEMIINSVAQGNQITISVVSQGVYFKPTKI